MKISENGVNLIKRFEGLRLKSYPCVAGVWTIGYGHSGKDVKEGMTISSDKAEELLLQDVSKFEVAVNRQVKVEVNQNQFDALVSWCYNLGEGNLKSSTMLKKLNEGNYDAVPSEMKRWNKAGGRVVQGLVNRRNEEASLFSKLCELKISFPKLRM